MIEDQAELLALLRGASGAARLATILDQEMLEGRGVEIASRVTPDARLPVKSGGAVFSELGDVTWCGTYSKRRCLPLVRGPRR